jgi:hypothetical protein
VRVAKLLTSAFDCFAQKWFGLVVKLLLIVKYCQFVHGFERVGMVGAEFFALGLTLKHVAEELLRLVVSALFSVEYTEMASRIWRSASVYRSSARYVSPRKLLFMGRTVF